MSGTSGEEILWDYEYVLQAIDHTNHSPMLIKWENCNQLFAIIATFCNRFQRKTIPTVLFSHSKCLRNSKAVACKMRSVDHLQEMGKKTK